jgi:hypothetical protein
MVQLIFPRALCNDSIEHGWKDRNRHIIAKVEVCNTWQNIGHLLVIPT